MGQHQRQPNTVPEVGIYFKIVNKHVNSKPGFRAQIDEQTFKRDMKRVWRNEKIIQHRTFSGAVVGDWEVYPLKAIIERQDRRKTP